MIFEGGNGSFGCICAMKVWRYKLKRDVARSKVFFERSRALIIEYLDFGRVAPIGKVIMQF